MTVLSASPVQNGQSKSHSSFTYFIKEVMKDKLAHISSWFLIFFLIVVYTSFFWISGEQASNVELMATNEAPSSEYWLGTDMSGKDIFAQLIVGARNSFTIGLAVTLISAFIGILLGIMAGYFGKWVDLAIMRFIDFMYILPGLMIIIVIVTIKPDFSMWTFILVMGSFLWVSKARLIRAKTLVERQKDYVKASYLARTPHWKILLSQVLPNLLSIIIINLTLSLAGNIGIETGLSFLGFGLPTDTPSLGNLVSNATNPEIIQNSWWMWLPACLLIFALILSINFIGQALKRATNARQRV